MLPGFYLGATLNLNYTPALNMGAPEYLEGQRDSYYFTGLGLPLQYIRDLRRLELEFSPVRNQGLSLQYGHRLPHRPRHGDDASNHSRNIEPQSAVGGSEASCPRLPLMPGRYSKTDNPDRPSRMR